MIVLLLLALLLAGLTLGVVKRPANASMRRFGAGVRGVAGVWRPTSALAATLLLVAALVLAVREDWPAALLLGAVGLGIALAARRRARRPADASASISVAEARAILGVGPNATRSDVQAAYRRLIQAVHPDRGGTSGLAARLNAARDVLSRSAA